MQEGKITFAKEHVIYLIDPNVLNDFLLGGMMPAIGHGGLTNLVSGAAGAAFSFE